MGVPKHCRSEWFRWAILAACALLALAVASLLCPATLEGGEPWL